MKNNYQTKVIQKDAVEILIDQNIIRLRHEIYDFPFELVSCYPSCLYGINFKSA